MKVTISLTTKDAAGNEARKTQHGTRSHTGLTCVPVALGEHTAGDRLKTLAEAGEPADADAVLALYDDLPAVAEEDMLGDWDGQVVPTSHPGERHLGGLRWAGKRFTDRDDVDPMMCLDEEGERQPSPVLGDASLRMVEYRGVSTATMVYDGHPIFDHFRRIDADTVVGAMDRKGEPAPLVFVLHRRR